MTVTVLRGRTSDRTTHGVRGAELLGDALARRSNAQVEHVGEPEPPREQPFEDDLRDGRASFAAAAAAAAAAAPVLLASQCSIALATLPVLAAREPEACVVWIDAHGDFNTPATTGSGYLGGMPLAAACGRWESGYGGGLDPARVVLSDARDLDRAEREELDRAGVRLVAPDLVAAAVAGERVFVHLDLDILDPSILPGAVPAPGGLSLGELRALLSDIAASAAIVGLEVTAFDPPEHDHLVEPLAEAIAPLLPR